MKKNLLPLLPVFLLFSCKEDTTPTWLQIDAIDLETELVSEGPDSENITDAWVYMDNKALGVFELPCKIPILAEGEHSFVIYAGVIVNGISGNRAMYPFYERFDTTLNLVKGETINLVPEVTYKENLIFELKEDFEIGVTFTPDIISDTEIVLIDKLTHPNIVEYGNYCGGVFLTQVDSIFKAATHTFLDLPKNEKVFMEIDYRNNNSIAMGVIAQNSANFAEHTPYVLMRAQTSGSEVWKKMYIDLTEDISWEVNATSYEIYLLSILDPENTSASIYIDNIKVIRYQ